jgi:hypothetical protein
VAAESGRVYMASDSQVEYYGDGGSWVKMGVGSSQEPVPSVTTDDLSTVYSHKVSSASGLENLDSNISQGDVVGVEQPDTPYRTSQWIDIDTPNVTIGFESRWSKDGDPAVRPADGSNVGGIRVGTGPTTITGVVIRNFGFHGNESTMDNTVKRLHGIIIDNATDVRLHNCFLTKTHPYHSHGDGGSGITVRKDAERVGIHNCDIDDIGDRGIQVAGDLITITGCTSENGYDRCMSLDVQQTDGLDYMARRTVVTGNYLGTNSDGSAIGAGGGSQRSDRGFWVISNNVMETNRSGWKMNRTDQPKNYHIAVIGNAIKGFNNNNGRAGIVLSADISSGVKGAVVAGNTIQNANGRGIADGGENGSIVVGNIVHNPSGDGIKTGSHHKACVGNLVSSPGGDGITVSGGGNLAAGNHVDGAGGNGIVFPSGVANRSVALGNFVERSSGSNYSIPSNDPSHIVENEAAETANAEEPQGSYPPGTFVRFTDSGDGSGTGTYLAARDGSFIQVATSA